MQSEVRTVEGPEHPSKWWKDAACENQHFPDGLDGPDIFYPANESEGSWEVQTAKQICFTCPVLDKCATWALALPEWYGIWGGMTPKERERLRRRKKRRRAAMKAGLFTEEIA